MATGLGTEIEEREIGIAINSKVIEGTLSIPQNSVGVVLFAHGSGSGRFSPRNRYVANVLQNGGLATLLVDLLTREEERVDTQTAHLRFDINMLATRLIEATKWLASNPDTQRLKPGYFGASTGAGAALVAAAYWADAIHAVVSRGGRPDLASRAVLRQVRAPTLLIVGGNDTPVIEMNRLALEHLNVEKRLEIISGATHLFEEPGKLERVAQLAHEWFYRHLHGGTSP